MPNVLPVQDLPAAAPHEPSVETREVLGRTAEAEDVPLAEAEPEPELLAAPEELAPLAEELPEADDVPLQVPKADWQPVPQ